MPDHTPQLDLSIDHDLANRLAAALANVGCTLPASVVIKHICVEALEKFLLELEARPAAQRAA